MDLRRRLATLPPRSPERRRLMHETARLYGVSEQTLYRVLRQQSKPRAVTRRMDRGIPRVLPQGDLTRYLELIAAVKLRTTNGKGRHLSTGEAIRLLEDYGLETPEGRVQAPKGAALSTCALILLHCYLICEFPRLSLGGNKHAAEHHLCPLRQGASDLCHGSSSLGEAPGCPPHR